MLNETLETNREYHKSLSEEYHRGYEQGKKDAQSEIIFCKDCTFCVSNNGHTSCVNTYDCNGMWTEVDKEKDFCSHGEKQWMF